MASSDSPKKDFGTQAVQLIVVVLVLGVLAYFAFSFLIQFIWWIVGILTIPLLIINRKLVFNLLRRIRDLYKRKALYGVLATVGGVIAFTPFVGFLFLKTIWDFRNSSIGERVRGKKQSPQSSKREVENIEYMEVDDPQLDADLDSDAELDMEAELRAIKAKNEAFKKDEDNH